jgi:Leucine-rich repeat (LRR) protein
MALQSNKRKEQPLDNYLLINDICDVVWQYIGHYSELQKFGIYDPKVVIQINYDSDLKKDSDEKNKVLKTMVNLKILILNRQFQTDNDLKYIPNLNTLNCSNNKSNYCDSDLKYIPNLKTLYCCNYEENYYKIKRLSKKFPYLEIFII